MKQAIVEAFPPARVDGTVTGGKTTGKGFEINWQDGPLIDSITETPIESNGAFLQTILEACIGRLTHYQSGKHKSRENAVALTHMETAQLWLGKREAERAERGVLGTHDK